ncbi:hypothetical protein YC2023_120597 [Brassica napus]
MDVDTSLCFPFIIFQSRVRSADDKNECSLVNGDCYLKTQSGVGSSNNIIKSLHGTWT